MDAATSLPVQLWQGNRHPVWIRSGGNMGPAQILGVWPHDTVERRGQVATYSGRLTYSCRGAQPLNRICQVAPPCNNDSHPHSSSKTTARSVQPFLHAWYHILRISYTAPPISSKIGPYFWGDLEPHPIHIHVVPLAHSICYLARSAKLPTGLYISKLHLGCFARTRPERISHLRYYMATRPNRKKDQK